MSDFNLPVLQTWQFKTIFFGVQAQLPQTLRDLKVAIRNVFEDLDQDMKGHLMGWYIMLERCIGMNESVLTD